MDKIKLWFGALSRVGKVSIISAILGGGFVTAAAMTPPSAPASPRTPVVTTKTETEVQPISFEKRIVEDGSLAQGMTRLQTAGINGVKTITHTITTTDGIETHRVSSEPITTTAPVDEVTIIGTYVKPAPSNCDSNYSGCVPIVSYDLDCSDIGFSVRVLGSDGHRFDGDHDGYGCEAY